MGTRNRRMRERAREGFLRVRLCTLHSLLCLLLIAAPVGAVAEPDSSDDFGDLSIEALMDIEVTSVSKKAQKLSGSAAAISVITSEDIRRSGATSIPELLRMVPGLHVARINSNQWAVGARGFNDYFVRSLLVLMDGRTLYSPLFGGVWWDQEDYVLQDIERIEVIRGPGGTLWGANAVNGVINIITKRAEDTQGGLAVLGVGTEDRLLGSARYGGAIGDIGHYRAYAKGFKRDSFKEFEFNEEANDYWQQGRAGFRMELAASDRDEITISGDLYRGVSEGSYTVPLLPEGTLPALIGFTAYDDQEDLLGGNLLSRWTHQWPGGGDTMLQGFYTRTERWGAVSDSEMNIYDAEFQHNFAEVAANDIVVGLGYRYQQGSYQGGNSGRIHFERDERSSGIFNSFIQDDIGLFDDRFHLILGVKLERNDVVGWEVQPNARFTWSVHENHTLWGAVSRAVHTPTWGEEDIEMVARVDCIDIASREANGENPCPGPPGGFPTQATMFGNPNGLVVEELVSYELGYRARLARAATLDIAGFYNQYQDLLGSVLGSTDLSTLPLGYVDQALIFESGIEGQAVGVEVEVAWQVLDRWRVIGTYTYQQVEAEFQNDLVVGGDDIMEDVTPRHQATLRSLGNLPYNLELDGMLRFLGDIRNIDSVDEYVELDLRLGWKPREDLELSLVGQNLLSSSHREYEVVTGNFTMPTRPERGVYAQVAWTF